MEVKRIHHNSIKNKLYLHETAASESFLHRIGRMSLLLTKPTIYIDLIYARLRY